MTTNTYLAWVDQIFSTDEGEELALLDLIPQKSAQVLCKQDKNYFLTKEFQGFPSLPLLVPLGGDFPSSERQLIKQIFSANDEGAALLVKLSESSLSQFPEATVALQGTDQEERPLQKFYISSIERASDNETRAINNALNLSQLISGVIDKSHIPYPTPSEFIPWLLRKATDHSDTISAAIYNVGQGNANALVDEWEHPLVLFDVGAPLTPFSWTRPTAFPKFFDCDHALNPEDAPKIILPPVILSHWDYDHWAGVISNIKVEKDPISGNRVAKFTLDSRALKRFWIAPDQTHLNLGVTHKELIRRLSSAKNRRGRQRLQYWPNNTQMIDFGAGALYKSTGTSRNDSGLFLYLKDKTQGDACQILLPGDASYDEIKKISIPKLAGLVVSHHGGSAGLPIQPHISPGNIVCSVGSPHPVTKKKPFNHPNTQSIDAHKLAGWRQPAYTYNAKPSPLGLSTCNYALTFDSSFSPRCTCGAVATANMSLTRP